MSESQARQSATTESRARRKIREAIEAKGWTVLRMEWEPIRAGAEKSGPEGGWYVEARAPSGGTDWVLGYSWQDAVEWAERWLAADKTSGLGVNP
jgi:hypothetical protein